MTTYIYYGETLYHHGILGQKWGIRRFQNEDGSLTPAGKKRYGYLEESANKASKFAEYAKEEKKKYSKGLSDSQKKNGVKQSDLDRWKKASTVQRQKYENLAKKYGSIDISKLDKNTIKEAKNFVKKGFYTDVEYADYFSGNRWQNYILKDGSSVVSPNRKNSSDAAKRHSMDGDGFTSTIKASSRNTI